MPDEEADHARDLEAGRVRYELEMEEHPGKPNAVDGQAESGQALNWGETEKKGIQRQMEKVWHPLYVNCERGGKYTSPSKS